MALTWTLPASVTGVVFLMVAVQAVARCILQGAVPALVALSTGHTAAAPRSPCGPCAVI